MKSWFKVWIDPRGVTREEIEKAESHNPTWKFLLIAYISSVLSIFMQFEWDEPISIQTVAIIAVFGGLIGAPLALFFFPWLTKWVGRWIGGSGSSLQVRIAVLNSSLKTNILVGIVSLPLILIVGETFFLSLAADASYFVPLSSLQNWALGILTMFTIVAMIWIFVISLHATGEAHGFSAWKSLLAYVILMAMGVALVLLLAMFVMVLLMF